MLAAERHSDAPGTDVLADLRDRFDDVPRDLEAVAGWQTNRTRRPVLVLGQLDGILTGIRQLRRTRPLETEEIAGLRVPTLAEMARIKLWLLATRNMVRDYLDAVVLLDRLGDDAVASAVAPIDELYQQPTGVSPLSEAIERLAAGHPEDEALVDLASYKGLRAPWNDWYHLRARGRHHARILAACVLKEGP